MVLFKNKHGGSCMSLSNQISFTLLTKGNLVAGICVFVLPDAGELAKEFGESFVDGYLGRKPIIKGHYKKSSFIHIKSKKIVFSHGDIPISRCPKYNVEEEDYEGLKRFLKNKADLSFNEYPSAGGFIIYSRSLIGHCKCIRPVY